MGRNLLIILIMLAAAVSAVPAHAQTETPTPTATPTETPTPTPTATPDPMSAVGAYYTALPSGAVGVITMQVTAGEAMITAAIMVLTVISIFRVLQAWTQAAKVK